MRITLKNIPLILLVSLLLTGAVISTVSLRDNSINIDNIGNITKSATCIVAKDNTGDYTTIQECLNSLPTSGGNVYIKNGTYQLSTSIKVKSNIELIGSGYSTFLNLSDNINDDVIENFNQTTGDSNITISNLRINGNAATQTGTLHGINFKLVQDSIIDNVWVENTKWCGINLENSTGNLITNCKIERTIGHGILLNKESNANRVLGNQIKFTMNLTPSASYGYGIYVYTGSKYNIIENNHLINITGHSISAQDDADYNIISTNEIINRTGASDSTHSSIKIYNSKGNKISENTIDGRNGLMGIELNSVNNADVTGNIIQLATTGIKLHKTENATINLNTILSSSQRGIHLYLSNSSSLIGNNIKTTGDYGIWLETSNNNQLSLNIISDTGSTPAIYSTDGTTGTEFIGKESTCTVDKNGKGDYSTIQACLNTLTSSGGKVLIKKGSYSEQLNITKSSIANITIECETGAVIGNGTDLTWLNITPPAGETYLDFKLLNCEFKGLVGENSPLKNNVYIDTVQRMEVRGNKFIGSNGCPNFNNVQDFLLTGNFMKSCRTTISGRTLTRTIISENTMIDAWDNFIDVGSIYSLIIKGNHGKSTNTTGTSADNGVFITNPNFGYTIVDGNTFENTDQNCLQLYVYASESEAGKVIFSNNYCYNIGTGSYVGLDVQGTPTRNITDVQIIGNHFEDTARGAIRFNENVSNFIISDNIIKNTGVSYQSGAHGIEIYRSYNGIIEGNVITNISAMPITVGVSSTDIQISNNQYTSYTTEPTYTGTRIYAERFNVTTGYLCKQFYNTSCWVGISCPTCSGTCCN